MGPKHDEVAGGAMLGATFKLRRELMGISRARIAREIKVNERTVRNWESGRWPIPPDGQAWMDQEWSSFLDRLGAILDGVERLADSQDGPPEGVDLAIYPSPESHFRACGPGQTFFEHAALIRCALLALELADHPVQVGWIPLEESGDDT